jgi:hypothetical protein
MISREQGPYNFTIYFMFLVVLVYVLPYQTCCFQISSCSFHKPITGHLKPIYVGHTDATSLASSFSSNEGEVEEDDDEEAIDLSNQDW